MQPHLGGFTDEGYSSLLTPAVDNVIAFLDGAPKNLVNSEAVAIGVRPSARVRRPDQ
jgi:phosphoglycerate dehydrogenase-like enzyme